MEKWLEDAKENIKEEADYSMWRCKKLAERENLEKDWVIEEFAKEFSRLRISKIQKEGINNVEY